MRSRLLWFTVLPMLLASEQLWEEKAQKQGRPKPPREQQALQLLRDDPQMRAMFIDRIAAPVANKMFECGMIP
jgi:hypothetical protein